MRFKAAVIPHLPVLVFGDRRKLTEGERVGDEGALRGAWRGK